MPVSAPLAGLDTASPITAMPESTARCLDNWVCRTDGLHTRAGTVTARSGLGSAVSTLLPYGSGVVACTATKLEGSVETFSSGEWIGDCMPNAAGLYLAAANGIDGVRLWNGSAWSTPQAISYDRAGVSTTIDLDEIVQVCVHQSRLWLLPRNSTTIYYLRPHELWGEARRLIVGPLLKKGGTIRAIASLTGDGGRSSTDKLVVASTEGEIVVYEGSDPNDSSTWGLGGVYTAPKPIGRRCFAQHGGHLAYLCTAGVVPLPELFVRGDPEKQLSALSSPIWPTIQAALGSGSWSMAGSMEQEILVVSGPSGQFVRSGNGGWSRFTGTGATCWHSAGGELWLGTDDGKVKRYAGSTDDGAEISSFMVGRFDRPAGSNIKVASRMRLMFRAAHPYRPRLTLLVDYVDPPTTFEAAWIDDQYFLWEDITWGRQPMQWRRETSSRLPRWRGVKGRGHAFAVMMGMKTRTDIVYTGADLMVEGGGQT